jgi:hypothetical protein
VAKNFSLGGRKPRWTPFLNAGNYLLTVMDPACCYGVDGKRIAQRRWRKKTPGSNVTPFAVLSGFDQTHRFGLNLSIQVHPSDAYALKNEGQYGKTEMWYIIEAEPGAGLYVGFKAKPRLKRYRQAFQDGSIVDLLNFMRLNRANPISLPREPSTRLAKA